MHRPTKSRTESSSSQKTHGNLPERIRERNAFIVFSAAVIFDEPIDKIFNLSLHVLRQYEDMEANVSILEHEQLRAANRASQRSRAQIRHRRNF